MVKSKSMFVTEKHQTLEEATYQHLRKAIIAGELAPGTKLVGSRLSTDLHVSRLTVANALKRLMSEGYVVGRPHREAIVALLDEASLDEIFLIRHTLETVVMQKVVAHITPAILTRLYDLNEQLRMSVERQDSVAYRQIEREYHLLIYTASELPLMTDMLIELWDRLEPYRGRRYSNLSLSNTAYDEHLSIHTALETRNEAQLIAAMRAHVDQGYERSRLTLTGSFTERISLKPAPARFTQKDEHDQAAPGSLRSAFASLRDTRRGQGKLHTQSAVLAMAVCAMLCGVCSRYGVAQWGLRCHPAIRTMLGLSHDRGPSIATVHRIFHQLNQEDFVRVLTQWFSSYGIPVVTKNNENRAEQSQEDTEREQLPGLEIISTIAQQIRSALGEEGEETASSISSPTRHMLAELPMLLLAGQTVTSNALIAQRELAHQIMSHPELFV